MFQIASGDDTLRALTGTTLTSEVARGVGYSVGQPLGSGGLSLAFNALRITPEGTAPVALKILRPSIVRRYGDTAALIVSREAVALGRLNERVPPTPFVVRLIDTGALTAVYEGATVTLPWLVTEYIHGGEEGVTLDDRVQHALEVTGEAFQPDRAVRVVESIAQGLVAVHEVGVIHRNLTPKNVLCAGADEDELFKIADFGLSRPTGMPGTVSGIAVGTPGYAAPELAMMDPNVIGPWSDIFSFASLVYYMLTGQPYFDVTNPGQALSAAVSTQRKSLLDSPMLSAELRAREQACRSIDGVLSWASSGRTELRLQEVLAFTAMLTPHLRVESERTLVRRGAPLLQGPPSLALPAARQLPPAKQHRKPAVTVPEASPWQWNILQRPGALPVVRSVGWDGDGRCVAATNEGLSFWNGTSWVAADVRGLPVPTGVRFVKRIDAGRWLLGGDGSTLAMFTTGGITDLVQIPEEATRFERLSGDLEDMALLLSVSPEGQTKIHTLIGRRWLKPYQLRGVAMVSGLARVEDTRWLLCGRSEDGTGYAAIYSPLEFDVERIPTPNTKVFLGCAGIATRNLGIAGGAAGAILWREGDIASIETIDPNQGISCTAVDTNGRGWAASAGNIWRRDGHGAWHALWSDPRWVAPIVSLYADVDAVLAVSADGGIVEGRRRRAWNEVSGPVPPPPASRSTPPPRPGRL
jgi:serine/threonine protein kinase